MSNPFSIDEVSLNAICSQECQHAKTTLRRDIPRSILLSSMGLGEDISLLCLSFLGPTSPLESLNLRCEDVCLHKCLKLTEQFRHVESPLELQKRARDLIAFLNDPLSHSRLRLSICQLKKLSMWGHVAVWWILQHTLDSCATQVGASKQLRDLSMTWMCTSHVLRYSRYSYRCWSLTTVNVFIIRIFIIERLRVSHCCYVGWCVEKTCKLEGLSKF